MSLIDSLAITLISGVILGTIYALMSLGLTLIYGISNVFNLAHGALFIWGAYLTWFLTAKVNLNLIVSAIISIVVLFFFGIFWERVFLRSKRSELVSVITICLGLMMILDSLAHVFFGPTQKSLPALVPGNVDLYFVTRSMNEVFNFFLAIIILGGLWWFLSKSRLGMAIRAVAEDNVGASIIGIDTNKIYALCFGIGVALAALSGILLAPEIYISTAAGGDALLKAIIIVILGGLGSAKGSLYAALMLGILESAVSMYIGMFWVLPSWFFVMLLILAVRPRGIYGVR